MNINKLKKHLNVCKTLAKFSKDPSTKVACRIIRPDGSLVSEGYNGFIKGCNEKYMTWERPLKYELILHAELNCVLHSNESLNKCIAIITDAPCNDCLKTLAQVGIRSVFYGKADIMINRGSLDQKEAIKRIIKSLNNLSVINLTNGLTYIEELEQK